MTTQPQDADELRKQLADKLEEILGQNYVDEYSGSDRPISVNEIARLFTPVIIQDRERAVLEAEYKLASSITTDMGDAYYQSIPIGRHAEQLRSQLTTLKESNQ